MNLKSGFYIAKAFAKENSPSILTGIAISGTATTAYLAGVAGYKTAGRLSEGPPTEQLPKKEIVREVWTLYIPAAVSGTITIGCIFGATQIASKRATAAYSLLAVSERIFQEYREKVVEELGEKKEKNIRDEVAQLEVTNNPPSNIIVANADGVLCCELLTGRYFLCDMETLRRSVNDINAKLLREDYCVIGEFYYLINIPFTSNSSRIGWSSDKLLELEFTTTLTEDGKPCLAFDYNYVKPF